MATSKPKLSATQRRLVREVNQIADLFNLSPSSILNEDPESWTPRLQLAKDQLVRSQVVVWYTLVDEFLNSRIAHYFFSRRRSFPQLWRTKRFKLFNYHVLEELSLLQKLRFVKAINAVPKRIVADIERLNALRNGLAHAFFPENLKKVRPEWKGQSILTIQALERFGEDMQKVFDYFLPM